MVWGESWPIPEASRIAQAFVEASDFHGLGGLELKRVGDRRFFIEFNPRLEAIHFLASRAGIDTVRMAYEDLALDRAPEPAPQGRATAWLGNAWVERLARTRDWRTALRDVVAFSKAPRKVFAVWSARDPLPWLVMMSRMVARFLGVRVQGIASREDA